MQERQNAFQENVVTEDECQHLCGDQVSVSRYLTMTKSQMRDIFQFQVMYPFGKCIPFLRFRPMHFLQGQCMFYTWFNSENRVFSNYCFLFSSCEQVKSTEMVFCQIRMATSSHPLSLSPGCLQLCRLLFRPPLLCAHF